MKLVGDDGGLGGRFVDDHGNGYADGVSDLAWLLAVLHRTAVTLHRSLDDVDALVIEAHAACLARGQQWPGMPVVLDDDELDRAREALEERGRVRARECEGAMGRGKCTCPICRCGYALDSMACEDWHAQHPGSDRGPQ